MMRARVPSAWMLASWLLVAAAFANAAAYIAYAGNPLVASDAWYFIGAFLQPALENGAAFQDYFVKRDGFDHAQPLAKLLLLLNARWLGLDFVFEAMIGLAFAASMFGVFYMSLRDAQQQDGVQDPSVRALGIAAFAAALVTLNCGMVFDWSLVTLAYLPYFLLAAGALAAWRAVRDGRFLPFALLSLVVAFAFDDVGLIINAGLAATAALAAVRCSQWKRGLYVVMIAIACEAAYAGFSNAFLVRMPATAGAGISVHLGALFDIRHQLPDVFRVALGSSLAHYNQLAYYVPGREIAVQWFLAGIVACAHGWFWWRAFRGRWNALVFLAVALMLVMYAFVAGIVYARVVTYGINYLNEPRYMVFYLLSNVALVAMLIGQPLRISGGAATAAARAALVGVLLLQVPLSRYTWHEGRYLGNYYHTMAAQMLAMGAGTVPENCVPLLTVCAMPPAQRDRAVDFLETHRLNVFAPEFLERYRLHALVPAQDNVAPPQASD